MQTGLQVFGPKVTQTHVFLLSVECSKVCKAVN